MKARAVPLLSAHTPHLIEAGLDEAGRGCLAGPVVAAAVVLPKSYTHPYLTDSKQLCRAERNRFRMEIERDAVAFAVAEVCSSTIDEINVLNASLLAMRHAVAKLAMQPQLLLVDGNRFHAYPGVPHVCVVRGDATYLSIAAASILAKTYRDELMLGLSGIFPQYGWAANAGYPTRAHYAAIRAHGVTPHHRLSFRLHDRPAGT